MKSLMVLSSVSLGNFPPDDPRPRFRSSRRETITSSEVERMASVLTTVVTDQFSNKDLKSFMTYRSRVKSDQYGVHAMEGV